MSRLIIITVSVIVAMLFVFNSYWLQFNGYSTIDIIERLPILFAPANYVYLIWFIVFIFLFLWVRNYFKLRQSEQFITKFQTILFSSVIIFQILFLVSWHYEQFVQSFLLLIVQLVLLFILYFTYPLKKEILRLRMPIAIYFGWTFYLVLLHFCYIFVYIGWQGFGLSNALWAVIIMTFGTAIALHLRYHHFDIAFPLVFVWCYVGIAFANGFDELLVTTAALFLSGVMVVGILLVKKSPTHLK